MAGNMELIFLGYVRSTSWIFESSQSLIKFTLAGVLVVIYLPSLNKYSWMLYSQSNCPRFNI